MIKQEQFIRLAHKITELVHDDPEVGAASEEYARAKCQEVGIEVPDPANGEERPADLVYWAFVSEFIQSLIVEVLQQSKVKVTE